MITADLQLFGREAVLQPLLDRLDRVAAGGGGFAVGLAGEPGVGKSALQSGIAAHAAAAGFTVLAARGRQSESQLSYAALHQQLQPVLARAEQLPDQQRRSLMACFGRGAAGEEINRFFTSLAVLELLVEATVHAPLLVCLDDVQWVDDPSVDALAFVIRRIAADRVAVVCTSRAESTLLGGDDSVAWIELGGLADDAAGALLRSRAPHLAPQLRERVVASAGGNPLALVEFASALASGSGGVERAR